MRRQFKMAGVDFTPGGFAPLLDDNPWRSPLGRDVILPHYAWACAMVAEAAAQGDKIIPDTMPTTQVFLTLLDRVVGAPDAARAEILSYAGHDAICYWAGKPDALRAREKSQWGRIIDGYVAQHMPWTIVLGLQAQPQPQDSLQRLEQALHALDDWRLGLLLLLTNLTGTALGSYWHLAGHLPLDDFRQAAFLPEIFRCDQAGEEAITAPHLLPKFAQLDHLCGLLADYAPGRPQALALTISGQVQGVGYRAWLQKTALSRGLGGYARNAADGTVRAGLYGPAEQLRAQLTDCLTGPARAQVRRIQVASIDAAKAPGDFAILPDA